MRAVRSTLIIAALVAATPAAADDGRRHVMTPTQKIDLVRDLPEEPAFERDGEYFDLGYLYPIHTMNGASVASASGDAGYVLYHDDKYARLSASDVAMLSSVLGEDATQGYTPPTPASTSRSAAAADPWGANGSADSSRGQPLASSPARASRRGGFTFGGLFLLFVVLFLRVRAFRDLVVGGVLAAIAGIASRRSEPDFSSESAGAADRLSAQAAAQRARLDALSGAAPTSPGGAQGGFGRRGL